MINKAAENNEQSFGLLVPPDSVRQSPSTEAPRRGKETAFMCVIQHSQVQPDEEALVQSNLSRLGPGKGGEQ